MIHALPDEAVSAIYQAVGGHPLAIKWIAGLARTYPLPFVLASWQQQAGYRGQIDGMYHSLWQVLTPVEQLLLSIMPLFA
ncbi:MAG: hypothetical protein IAF02_26025 [Anaerolineae bacterium]|nr:hypothetical protein [Anaerolineae bacterium]